MSSGRKGLQPETFLIRKTECKHNKQQRGIPAKVVGILRVALRIARWDGKCDSGEEWTLCVHKEEPDVEPPNEDDKGMAISKVKNGKRTGHDQIPAEVVKEGGK